MALATQCPHCYTSFRVANDQLKLYGGMVRCGACKQTFNGIEHLIPPGSSPKPPPVPEPSPLSASLDQTQDENQSNEQEQPQEILTISVETSEDQLEASADNHDEFELESNLRALLEEIKIRQQDEATMPDDTEQSMVNAAVQEEHTEAPVAEDHTAEDAVAHLEIIPQEEEAQPAAANKIKTKALSASIDFDLDDEQSPISASINRIKKPLDVGDIEEIKTLETAIESELNLYEDHEKSETTAAPINPYTSKFKPENLSPDVEEPAHQDADDSSLAQEDNKEETPDFVIRAQRKQRYGKWTSLAFSLGVLIALCGAIAQSSYFFRNVIAAEYPQTKPLLLKLCQWAKCDIKLPAQKSQLEISGSELQILTNDPLVNELNFQIQNKGKSAQTWPHLELILKDIRGKTILQKVIAPAIYLENKTQLATGIPANSESAHKLNFELGIPKASSYTVELFYP